MNPRFLPCHFPSRLPHRGAGRLSASPSPTVSLSGHSTKSKPAPGSERMPNLVRTSPLRGTFRRRRSLAEARLVRGTAPARVVALAGYEARVVGGEEMDDGCHFFRATHAPHRDLLSQPPDVLRWKLREQGRLDQRRRDRVDPDAVAYHLLGERLGQADHTGFGDAVRRRGGVALLARYGGHVHYGAAAPLAHVTDHRPATTEDRGEVDCHQPLPFLVGDLPQRRVAAVDAGVVDENIQSSEALQRVLDHGSDVFEARDVGADGRHFGPVGAKVLGCGDSILLIPVGDHHARAGLREPFGDRIPDARCPTGHHGYPAAEFQKHPLTPYFTSLFMVCCSVLRNRQVYGTSGTWSSNSAIVIELS